MLLVGRGGEDFGLFPIRQLAHKNRRVRDAMKKIQGSYKTYSITHQLLIMTKQAQIIIITG
jgi:hypothetical protein